MKEGQRFWTRDELILTMNLYCKLPFGQYHSRNPDVIKLAKLIDRTSGSIAFKLGNLASLDPTLKERGIKGTSHASKLDREVWDEFYNNWDILPYESEKLLAELENTSVEELNNIVEPEILQEGKTREAIVKIRVNQAFFRKTVIASYNYSCCITGIANSELLIAGHIKPWGLDEGNRLNPRNGLSLNALHDKAFEAGLITITPEYRIKISTLLKSQTIKSITDNFLKYENQEIKLPSKFLPDPVFLEYHNKERFRN